MVLSRISLSQHLQQGSRSQGRTSRWQRFPPRTLHGGCLSDRPRETRAPRSHPIPSEKHQDGTYPSSCRPRRKEALGGCFTVEYLVRQSCKEDRRRNLRCHGISFLFLFFIFALFVPKVRFSFLSLKGRGI